MSQNKTNKYFKYAIGEILLVVIGILIALQINNWNEAKKTKEKEHQVLTEIISDLKYNIQDLDSIVNKNTYNLKRNIKSIKTLVSVLQSNQQYHDSLGFYFRAVNSFDLPDYKTSGFQSLTSIGMDLIENPEIRSSIGSFFTSSITETQLAYNEIRDDFYNYMLDYYRNDFKDINEGLYKKALEPNNFEALKGKSDYIQSLRAYLNVNEFYLVKTNKALDKATKLKNNIEIYLKEH